MKPSLRGEDGAVAVVVAVFMAFAIMGFAALSIDLGGLWQSQRSLVTDTDAAALAGAVTVAHEWMATGSCDSSKGEQAAKDVLSINGPEDTVVEVDARCAIDPVKRSFTGSVLMTARQGSMANFSQGAELSIGGTTTATFQLRLGEVEGFAVCTNVFGGPDATSSPMALPSNPNLLAIPYKDPKSTMDKLPGIEPCPVSSPPSGNPTAPGAWGWLVGSPCLPGETVAIECAGNVGNDELKKQFAGQVGARLRFPIYESARGQGSGPNNGARFTVIGHAEATLVGTCLSGSSPFDPKDCKAPFDTSFNGQPGFVVVSNVETFYYYQGVPNARMFSDAQFSVCDVDGSNRFCP